MITKFKNWYCNLLSFQKIRFWQDLLSFISYFVFLFLCLPQYKTFGLVCVLLICLLCALGVFCLIGVIFNPDELEIDHILYLRYQKQEEKIQEWFGSMNRVKVSIKPNEDAMEILLFYHHKHLLVNAFYIERSTESEKTLYSILADCQGQEDKVVFSDEIENPGYILARFTLAD